MTLSSRLLLVSMHLLLSVGVLALTVSQAVADFGVTGQWRQELGFPVESLVLLFALSGLVPAVVEGALLGWTPRPSQAVVYVVAGIGAVFVAWAASLPSALRFSGAPIPVERAEIVASCWLLVILLGAQLVVIALVRLLVKRWRAGLEPW